jgi:hypothetical protein
MRRAITIRINIPPSLIGILICIEILVEGYAVRDHR